MDELKSKRRHLTAGDIPDGVHMAPNCKCRDTCHAGECEPSNTKTCSFTQDFGDGFSFTYCKTKSEMADYKRTAGLQLSTKWMDCLHWNLLPCFSPEISIFYTKALQQGVYADPKNLKAFDFASPISNNVDTNRNFAEAGANNPEALADVLPETGEIRTPRRKLLTLDVRVSYVWAGDDFKARGRKPNEQKIRAKTEAYVKDMHKVFGDHIQFKLSEWRKVDISTKTGTPPTGKTRTQILQKGLTSTNSKAMKWLMKTAKINIDITKAPYRNPHIELLIVPKSPGGIAGEAFGDHTQEHVPNTVPMGVATILLNYGVAQSDEYKETIYHEMGHVLGLFHTFEGITAMISSQIFISTHFF